MENLAPLFRTVYYILDWGKVDENGKRWWPAEAKVESGDVISKISYRCAHGCDVYCYSPCHFEYTGINWRIAKQICHIDSKERRITCPHCNGTLRKTYYVGFICETCSFRKCISRNCDKYIYSRKDYAFCVDCCKIKCHCGNVIGNTKHIRPICPSCATRKHNIKNELKNYKFTGETGLPGSKIYHEAFAHFESCKS